MSSHNIYNTLVVVAAETGTYAHAVDDSNRDDGNTLEVPSADAHSGYYLGLGYKAERKVRLELKQ